MSCNETIHYSRRSVRRRRRRLCHHPLPSLAPETPSAATTMTRQTQTVAEPSVGLTGRKKQHVCCCRSPLSNSVRLSVVCGGLNDLFLHPLPSCLPVDPIQLPRNATAVRFVRLVHLQMNFYICSIEFASELMEIPSDFRSICTHLPRGIDIMLCGLSLRGTHFDSVQRPKQQISPDILRGGMAARRAMYLISVSINLCRRRRCGNSFIEYHPRSEEGEGNVDSGKMRFW